MRALRQPGSPEWPGRQFERCCRPFHLFTTTSPEAGVEHFVRTSGWFDASHQVESRERCRRRHGHRWTVEVERYSGRDLKPEEVEELAAALRVLLNEWHDRDLNEMIHQFNETTPERLAPWIMERLLATTQMMTEVVVSDGIATARAVRPLELMLRR